MLLEVRTSTVLRSVHAVVWANNVQNGIYTSILLVYMLVPFVAIGQCIATIWLREIWVDPNNQHVGSMANLEFQVRVVQ